MNFFLFMAKEYLDTDWNSVLGNFGSGQLGPVESGPGQFDIWDGAHCNLEGACFGISDDEYMIWDDFLFWDVFLIFWATYLMIGNTSVCILGAAFFIWHFFGLFSGLNCPGPNYPFFRGGQSGTETVCPELWNLERPCYINCFMFIFFFSTGIFFPRNAKISVGGLARDQLLPGSNRHRLQHWVQCSHPVGTESPPAKEGWIFSL